MPPETERIFFKNALARKKISLFPGFPWTFVVVEMASYPGPDGEDDDGGKDEGEDGGPPHPELLMRNKLIH